MIPLMRPYFDERERALLEEVLESGWVTQGPFVAKFEGLFKEHHAVRHALATTSGTAALHLACLALGIGPGDEVVVPAFTWVTSAHCVEYTGARVVFADIVPETFTIDPLSLQAALTTRTKAVIAVHLFGLPAALDEIMAIAHRHGLAVIEDAACAVGTRYKEVPVGGTGRLGCFSFHPRKIITTGEGGMVTMQDDETARMVAMLRNQGAAPRKGPSKPYELGSFDTLGYNLRMSDIQAAVGVAQMEKLDGMLRERIARARFYDGMLSRFQDCGIPVVPECSRHTYQSYVIRLRDGGKARRDRIMDHMAARGIQTRPGTHAVHRLSYYARKYAISPGDYPASCEGEDLTMALPLYVGMTEREQQQVVEALKQGLDMGE